MVKELFPEAFDSFIAGSLAVFNNVYKMKFYTRHKPSLDEYSKLMDFISFFPSFLHSSKKVVNKYFRRTYLLRHACMALFLSLWFGQHVVQVHTTVAKVYKLILKLKLAAVV